MDDADRRSLRAIGLALRSIRARRRLTQGQVAHDAGLSPSTVGAIERGQSQSSITVLFLLANALGVEAREVMEIAAEIEADA